MLSLACLLFVGLSTAGQVEDAASLVKSARIAFDKKDMKRVLILTEQAIDREPANVQAHYLRGLAHESLAQHKEAVLDYRKVLDVASPGGQMVVEVHDRIGSELFKLGKAAESIEHFDRAIRLRPELGPGHWKRGISLYYVGRFDEGKQQFEGYEKVDRNDVENAVWQFLCAARSMGVDRARASMLKVGKDPRVPMMEVYDLFRGQRKPDEVMKAVKAGTPQPEELNQRLFYAHLYLGLYHDAMGDRVKAVEHLTKAAHDFPHPHYMGDVARHHLRTLTTRSK